MPFFHFVDDRLRVSFQPRTLKLCWHPWSFLVNVPKCDGVRIHFSLSLSDQESSISGNPQQVILRLTSAQVTVEPSAQNRPKESSITLFVMAIQHLLAYICVAVEKVFFYLMVVEHKCAEQTKWRVRYNSTTWCPLVCENESKTQKPHTCGWWKSAWDWT